VAEQLQTLLIRMDDMSAVFLNIFVNSFGQCSLPVIFGFIKDCLASLHRQSFAHFDVFFESLELF